MTASCFYSLILQLLLPGNGLEGPQQPYRKQKHGNGDERSRADSAVVQKPGRCPTIELQNPAGWPVRPAGSLWSQA